MATLFNHLSPEQPSTWTVSELTNYIRELFDIDYRLQDVQVEGEISNYHPARSGHLYFTLKDGGASLRCVMWRDSAQRLRFTPQDGDRIVASGRVSVYETNGVYQLYATRLRPAGRGDLAQAFEMLKSRLAAEGLFDAAYKKPLHPFPQRIGIVTSADAAALRDILNVLRRRFPLVEVIVAPTLVQGEQAPPQIISALTQLDARDDIDTIIIARGGGSLEDLWAFNDEQLAYAIFAARHPIICGVGHETDFTIADFVADLRAPTPSAAAELAVPDIAEIANRVVGLSRLLNGAMHDRLQTSQQQLAALQRVLNTLTPEHRLRNSRQRVDELAHRLDQAVTARLSSAAADLRLAQARLETVSPLATLARGYAIVRDGDGRLLRSPANLRPGSSVSVQLADGRFSATVDNVEES